MVMVSNTPIQVLNPPTLHEFKNGEEHEFQYTRWLLTALGLWSIISNNEKRSARIFSGFTIGLFVFTIVYILIPCILFVAIKIKTWKERLGFLGPLEFHTTNPLKYICIVYHLDKMKKCANQMKSDWLDAVTKEEQNVMLEGANIGRSLTRVCAFFMLSAAACFQAMATFKPKEVDAFNVTIRPHILPRYDFYFDTQKTPAFEITYGFHIIHIFFLYAIEISVCHLVAVFIGHICGQVQVIKLKLEVLEKCDRSEDFTTPIASIIDCHVKMLIFVGNVRKATREICLLEVLYSITGLCWLEFTCLKEWRDHETLILATYFLLLISAAFNIFMLCYSGEIMKNKCESVAELAYNIDWCHIPPKNLASLVLIISMARYPVSLTAGGMMDLRLESFSDIVKGSVVYFQILRTVTG